MVFQPKLDETSNLSSSFLSYAKNETSGILEPPVDSQQQEGQEGEMSLWMARGILLLVAAIWGTNFAVRGHTNDVLEWLL